MTARIVYAHERLAEMLCSLTDAVRARDEHAENAAKGIGVRHGLHKLLRQAETPLVQQKWAACPREFIEPCA